MKDMLSPSIICADLLNLEREVHLLEEAKVDFIHVDMGDTTLTSTTMLPPDMLPRFRAVTDIPLDIHIMLRDPEHFIYHVLPYCTGGYVTVQAESTTRIQQVAEKVKEAGGGFGIALNYGTPLAALDSMLLTVDMITIILANCGPGSTPVFNEEMRLKVRRCRQMLDEAGRTDVPIEVDGGVSFEVAKGCRQEGASMYVLGTKSIYRKDWSVVERCALLREHLAKGGKG